MKFLVFVMVICLGSAPDGGMKEEEQEVSIEYLERKIVNRKKEWEKTRFLLACQPKAWRPQKH